MMAASQSNNIQAKSYEDEMSSCKEELIRGFDSLGEALGELKRQVQPDASCMPSIVAFVQLVIAKCESEVDGMRKKVMEMTVDSGSYRSEKKCCSCEKTKHDEEDTEEGGQPAKKAKLDKEEEEQVNDEEKACPDLVIDEDTSSRTLSVDEEDRDAVSRNAKNVLTEESCGVVADDVGVDLHPLDNIAIDVSAAIAENIVPEMLSDIEGDTQEKGVTEENSATAQNVNPEDCTESGDEPVKNMTTDVIIAAADSATEDNHVETVENPVVETLTPTYIVCGRSTKLCIDLNHIVNGALDAGEELKKDINNNNEVATEATENPLGDADTRADEDRVPTISLIVENVMEASRYLTGGGGGEKTDSDEDRAVRINGVFHPPTTPPNTENEDTEDDM